VRRFTFGDFPLWRVAHAALGTLALGRVDRHTGGRLGSNSTLRSRVFLGVVVSGRSPER
jgi:hypothetical protein